MVCKQRGPQQYSLVCIKEQGGKVYTVGEKIQNTKLSGFFDERTIDFKINREDREHGQEFPMQRPHFSRKIRCMTRCLTLVSSKSPYPPQFYSLPYKMNEVKIFLFLPVNLTQKNNMKCKLIYSTAQRYLVQVACKKAH